MALTIYHKACPRCAAIILASAGECDCGHRFAGGEEADTPDEELFFTYLTARVDQALSELGARHAELIKNPGDFSRMTAIMRAVREAQAARDELEAHRYPITAPGGGGTNDTTATLAVTPSAEPTPEFRCRQAAKAARIVASGYAAGDKACPQCHTPVLPSAVRCQCGYFFQIDPPLPAASLTGAKPENTHRPSRPDPDATPDPKR